MKLEALSKIPVSNSFRLKTSKMLILTFCFSLLNVYHTCGSIEGAGVLVREQISLLTFLKGLGIILETAM